MRGWLSGLKPFLTESTAELKSDPREVGFKDVEVVKKGDALPPTHYLIDGHFTVLHPGSQQERLWAEGDYVN